MIRVDELTRENIEDLVELALEHHNELGDGHRSFDESAVRRSCDECISDPDRAYLNAWIAYSNDKPIGYIVGTSWRFFQNHDYGSRQELLFVRKLFRITETAKLLVDEYEEWARDRGVVLSFMGVEHPQMSTKVEKIGRGMQRLGYEHRGAYFTKELQ